MCVCVFPTPNNPKGAATAAALCGKITMLIQLGQGAVILKILCRASYFRVLRFGLIGTDIRRQIANHLTMAQIICSTGRLVGLFFCYFRGGSRGLLPWWK